MSKNRLVLILGIILVLVPFLGFPSSWEDFFVVAIGVILIWLTVSISLNKRLGGGKNAGASRRRNPIQKPVQPEINLETENKTPDSQAAEPHE